MTTTLVIANKLYSSWSMRAWLLLTELAIPFEEIVIPLRRPDTSAAIRRHSPAGKVPVLVDGDVTVWDTLAIVEYAAERWPDAGVWPRERGARALARAISAEMHAGFMPLRRACPMDLGHRFAERDRGEEMARDVARIEAIWTDARTRYGASGPYLFGAFSAADAMYAPVVARFEGYGIAVDPEARAYMDTILRLPSYRAWREAALREPWTIADYRNPADAILADHRQSLGGKD